MKRERWKKYSVKQYYSGVKINEEFIKEKYRRNQSVRFFFDISDRVKFSTQLANWKDDKLFRRVKAITDGDFLFFSRIRIHTGFPPDWHYNYVTQSRLPDDKHWSAIDDFEYGDIKVVWELNRFSFIYELVRVYWRTGNTEIPEIFWRLVEDWQEQNPLNTGANWKCGQEVAFRVMAWCWGLYGFLDAPSTTPMRIENIIKMIFMSGTRIERNISYALSQKNNHGFSEAVGLYTIGILFPELKYSKRWKKKGKILIEEQALKLINHEGAFTQNSVNYHRLVLHNLLWAFRLGELNGERFRKCVRDRFRKASELLYQLQEEKTGYLPNYGANDGALILPLSSCDYRDYRPVLQAAFNFLDRVRIYEDGLWDEDLLWLFGPDAVKAPVRKKNKIDLELNNTGYYTMRSENGFLFTRCGRHLFRPGQPDMLHVDIWWKGHNIAIDPGTYSYNAVPPWDKGLGSTKYHNTVTVDDFDQMDSYGKFLSFPWITGSVLSRKSIGEGIEYFEGTHNGYHRLKDPVTYKRGILQCSDDLWIIIDKLSGTIPHRYRLQWLLSDFPHKFDEKQNNLTLSPDNKEYQIHYGTLNDIFTASFIKADENSPRGWWSPYYYYKEPALSLELITNDITTLFYTVLGPGEISVQKHQSSLHITINDTEYAVELNPRPDDEPIVCHINNINTVSDMQQK